MPPRKKKKSSSAFNCTIPSNDAYEDYINEDDEYAVNDDVSEYEVNEDGVNEDDTNCNLNEDGVPDSGDGDDEDYNPSSSDDSDENYKPSSSDDSNDDYDYDDDVDEIEDGFNFSSGYFPTGGPQQTILERVAKKDGLNALCSGWSWVDDAPILEYDLVGDGNGDDHEEETFHALTEIREVLKKITSGMPENKFDIPSCVCFFLGSYCSCMLDHVLMMQEVHRNDRTANIEIEITPIAIARFVQMHCVLSALNFSPSDGEFLGQFLGGQVFKEYHPAFSAIRTLIARHYSESNGNNASICWSLKNFQDQFNTNIGMTFIPSHSILTLDDHKARVRCTTASKLGLATKRIKETPVVVGHGVVSSAGFMVKLTFEALRMALNDVVTQSIMSIANVSRAYSINFDRGYFLTQTSTRLLQQGLNFHGTRRKQESFPISSGTVKDLFQGKNQKKKTGRLFIVEDISNTPCSYGFRKQVEGKNVYGFGYRQWNGKVVLIESTQTAPNEFVYIQDPSWKKTTYFYDTDTFSPTVRRDVLEQFKAQFVEYTVTQSSQEWFYGRYGRVTSSVSKSIVPKFFNHQNFLRDHFGGSVDQKKKELAGAIHFLSPLLKMSDGGIGLHRAAVGSVRYILNSASLGKKQLVYIAQTILQEKNYHGQPLMYSGYTITQLTDRLCERIIDPSQLENFQTLVESMIIEPLLNFERTIAQNLLDTFFMRSVNSDAMELGRTGEQIALSKLGEFLTKTKSKRIPIMLTTTGISLKKDNWNLATSVDGLLLWVRKNAPVEQRSIKCSPVEIKTLSGKSSVAQLDDILVYLRQTNSTAANAGAADVWKVLHLKLSAANTASYQVFQRVVPVASYRCQLLHHAVVTGLDQVLYVVVRGEPMEIEYCVFVDFGKSFLDAYNTVLHYLSVNFVDVLRREVTSIKKFKLDTPVPASLSKLKLKGAADVYTIWQVLAIQRQMDEHVRKTSKPNPAAKMIKPKGIPLWNRNKPVLDSTSQDLARCKAKYGRMKLHGELVLFFLSLLLRQSFVTTRNWKFISENTERRGSGALLGSGFSDISKFREKRRAVMPSFKRFLLDIANDDLVWTRLAAAIYIPNRRPADWMNRSSVRHVNPASNTNDVQPRRDGPMAVDEILAKATYSGKTRLCRMQTDHEFRTSSGQHFAASFPEPTHDSSSNSNAKRTYPQQRRCILCCSMPLRKYRLGNLTTKFCIQCTQHFSTVVTLCCHQRRDFTVTVDGQEKTINDTCFNIFHSHMSLPTCTCHPNHWQ